MQAYVLRVESTATVFGEVLVALAELPRCRVADTAQADIAVPDRCLIVVPPAPVAIRRAFAVGPQMTVAVLTEPETFHLRGVLAALLSAAPAALSLIVSRDALSIVRTAPHIPERLETLLGLILQGESLERSAEKLNESVATAKRDLLRLKAILDAPNRTMLVKVATQMGYANDHQLQERFVQIECDMGAEAV